MKIRHSLRLYDHYKDYNKFFKENKLEILQETIDMYYDEFCTSTSLRKYEKSSVKFFEYLIHRLHMLGTFNMFDYDVPLLYKGYKAIFSFDAKHERYYGYVEGHFDCDISGNTYSDIEEDFKNTVDYVLELR